MLSYEEMRTIPTHLSSSSLCDKSTTFGSSRAGREVGLLTEANSISGGLLHTSEKK